MNTLCLEFAVTSLSADFRVTLRLSLTEIKLKLETRFDAKNVILVHNSRVQFICQLSLSFIYLTNCVNIVITSLLRG